MNMLDITFGQALRSLQCLSVKVEEYTTFEGIIPMYTTVAVYRSFPNSKTAVLMDRKNKARLVVASVFHQSVIVGTLFVGYLQHLL